MGKILSPAADADSACVTEDMNNGTIESIGAEASATRLGANDNQEVNMRMADLEVRIAELDARMRDSHHLNLPPKPTDVGIDVMEARVREIQVHVTKIDSEVQRIGCMEQRFAAASDHWIETERKLAERIDSIGAQTSASHRGAD